MLGAGYMAGGGIGLYESCEPQEYSKNAPGMYLPGS